MDTNLLNCNRKDANEVTFCDAWNISHDNCKKYESQLVLNSESSSLSDIIQRASMQSLKTLAHMNRNKVKLVEATVEKLDPADYFHRLKSMIAIGVRPNVVIKFDKIDFIIYSTVLDCDQKTCFEYEIDKYITLSLDRISRKSYKQLYKWMISEKPIHVRCFELLDLVDPWTYLYRNIGTAQCYDYFFDKSLVNYKAFLMFWETKRRNYKDRNLFLDNRIKGCFLDLVASQQFVQLDIKEVCVILQSSCIGVNTEVETFMAAVRWLSHDWNARKQHSYKIMKSVRFKLIAPSMLISLINDEAKEVRHIVSIYSVLCLINAGMEFNLVRIHFGKDKVGWRTFTRLNGIIAPVERSWIYDKNCSYHHKLNCKNVLAFGYKDFMKYMSELKNTGRQGWKAFLPLDSDKCPCRKSHDEIDAFSNITNILPHLSKMVELHIQKRNKRLDKLINRQSQRKQTSLSSFCQKDFNIKSQCNSSEEENEIEIADIIRTNDLKIRMKKYFLGLTYLSQISPCSEELKFMNTKSQCLSNRNVLLDKETVFYCLTHPVLRFKSCQCFGRKQAIIMEYNINSKYQQLKLKKIIEMKQQNKFRKSNI